MDSLHSRESPQWHSWNTATLLISRIDQRELLPEQHIVDAGYVDAELLVARQTE
jgi:hypothetical protein